MQKQDDPQLESFKSFRVAIGHRAHNRKRNEHGIYSRRETQWRMVDWLD